MCIRAPRIYRHTNNSNMHSETTSSCTKKKHTPAAAAVAATVAYAAASALRLLSLSLHVLFLAAFARTLYASLSILTTKATTTKKKTVTSHLSDTLHRLLSPQIMHSSVRNPVETFAKVKPNTSGTLVAALSLLRIVYVILSRATHFSPTQTTSVLIASWWSIACRLSVSSMSSLADQIRKNKYYIFAVQSSKVHPLSISSLHERLTIHLTWQRLDRKLRKCNIFDIIFLAVNVFPVYT